MEEGNLTSQQESRWIELAQGGDLSAFNQLVMAYQDMAFRLAMRLLTHEAAAKDVVQRVFLSAFCQIKSFRGTSLRGWLLRITHNACVDEIRRNKRHPFLPLEPQFPGEEETDEAEWMVDPGMTPEESLIQNETFEKIEQILRQLPEPFRTVVILIDMEALDYAEAATVLSVSLGTVKSRLGRARARLREILRKEHQGSGITLERHADKRESRTIASHHLADLLDEK